MHSLQIKTKVLALRKAGYSYSDIQKRTGISQATLSDWLSGVPYTPNEHVKAKIKKARSAAREAIKRKNAANEVLAKHDAEKIMGVRTARDMFMLGLGLYLGEGDKSGRDVSLSNSDPDILALGLRFFLSLPEVTRNNIAVRVHIYPDLDPREVVSFWSKKLHIPVSQFGACVIDKRVKKMKPRPRKLFFGTAHLIIRARGNPAAGRHLARVMRSLLQQATSQG